MKAKSKIDLEVNLKITGWEGDPSNKIYEHKTHNIWLDNGRTWLAQLMLYNMAGYGVVDPPPPDPEPGTTYMDSRLMYAGVGIGGNQQTGPIPTDVGTAYPAYGTGGNTFSDADVTVPGLERPVRIRSDYAASWARWLLPVGTIIFPATTPYYWVTLRFQFTPTDINEAIWFEHIADPSYVYPIVPLSEICLCPWGPTANAGTHYMGAPYTPDPPPWPMQSAAAYATFPTYNKPPSGGLTAEWELHFV